MARMAIDVLILKQRLRLVLLSLMTIVADVNSRRVVTTPRYVRAKVSSLSHWCPRTESRLVRCVQTAPPVVPNGARVMKSIYRWKKQVAWRCCPGYQGKNCQQACLSCTRLNDLSQRLSNAEQHIARLRSCHPKSTRGEPLTLPSESHCPCESGPPGPRGPHGPKGEPGGGRDGSHSRRPLRERPDREHRERKEKGESDYFDSMRDVWSDSDMDDNEIYTDTRSHGELTNQVSTLERQIQDLQTKLSAMQPALTYMTSLDDHMSVLDQRVSRLEILSELAESGSGEVAETFQSGGIIVSPMIKDKESLPMDSLNKKTRHESKAENEQWNSAVARAITADNWQAVLKEGGELTEGGSTVPGRRGADYRRKIRKSRRRSKKKTKSSAKRNPRPVSSFRHVAASDESYDKLPARLRDKELSDRNEMNPEKVVSSPSSSGISASFDKYMERKEKKGGQMEEKGETSSGKRRRGSMKFALRGHDGTLRGHDGTLRGHDGTSHGTDHRKDTTGRKRPGEDLTKTGISEEDVLNPTEGGESDESSPEQDASNTSPNPQIQFKMDGHKRCSRNCRASRLPTPPPLPPMDIIRELFPNDSMIIEAAQKGADEFYDYLNMVREKFNYGSHPDQADSSSFNDDQPYAKQDKPNHTNLNWKMDSQANDFVLNGEKYESHLDKTETALAGERVSKSENTLPRHEYLRSSSLKTTPNVQCLTYQLPVTCLLIVLSLQTFIGN